MKGLLIIVALLLALLPVLGAAASNQNSPQAVISYLRDAYDADSWDGALKVWWPDGIVIRDRDGKPPKEKISFKEQPMSGVGVQYRTTLTFLSTQMAKNRAFVTTSERSRTFYDSSSTGEYEYVGMYSINRVKYVCEMRGGQWRILSREIVGGQSYGSDIEWRRRDDAKKNKPREVTK